MAFGNGPRIVTDGLVLALDAADRNSYVSGSTTWRDISGNNNNGTMFGTVPYETDSSQCFNFSTVSGSGIVPSQTATLGFTFSSNMVTTTGDFSFSCWVKNPPASSGQVTLFSNTGGGDGYRYGIGLNGIYYLIGPAYKEGTLSFISSMSSDLWYHVTTVFNRSGTAILCYLNGILQSSTTLGAQTAMQNGTPGMVRNSCCGLYTGKVGSFIINNKALLASEILQNYNAQKSRFGL
jgi:hypothetical protein